ncbi:hypothetical protein NQ317_013133 [Molorchus minor]|uniref:THAP4-like heme-binding domain-containing protein n=1 Tax=Molorchus minor TaxID=1323400 RepID=A0ABQ9J2G2_9CUCU|nr:hypothetical protein NQ317_013133 [Molorchus minor]
MQYTKGSNILKPVCWIVGKWKSIKAEVRYPKLSSPIIFEGVLTFSSFGKPMLNYSFVTWKPEDQSPLHMENGFLHVEESDKPSSKVALVVSDGSGRAMVEEGLAKNKQLILNTCELGFMTFIKCEQRNILSLHRHFKLNDRGQLEFNTMLQLQTSPLSEHIKACFEKCDS